MFLAHPYHQALNFLSEKDLCLLQRVYLVEFNAVPSSLAPSDLEELERFSLVVQTGELWQCTPKGVGVLGWWRQLLCADLLSLSPAEIPCPREGENGFEPRAVCRDYRPALFRPGFCWCGHTFNAHLPCLGWKMCG